MPGFCTISHARLGRLIGTPECPVLIDVRTAPDFEADPRMIPGAFRHPHETIEALGRDYADRRVITICQQGKKLPEGAAAQAEAALATIGRTLREAGFAFEDVVRSVVYLVDPADHAAIAPALRAALGEIRPANTTVVTALIRPEMRVEIEVTALRRA